MGTASVLAHTPGFVHNRSPHRIESGDSNTILIVEDDADMILGMRVLLGAHYYETAVATNAAEAVTQATKCHPDLILLDLGLPGIDGFQLLEYFGRRYLSTVPVIVVSGRERRQNKERALRAGAVGYLQKPWNNEELLELIDRYSGCPPCAA